MHSYAKHDGSNYLLQRISPLGEEGAEEEEAVRKERRKRRQLEQNGIHWVSMLGGQDLDSGRLLNS